MHSLPLLPGWSNFYQIVGSAAGALTGLQFIVITLLATARISGTMQEIHAFGTPTVVHFCTALLISAGMDAPWYRLSDLAVCLGVCGALGLAYSLRVFRHARRAAYTPDAEDWFWYAVIPLVLHASLAVAAILIRWWLDLSAVIVAVTSLLFLFVGVHNSWDTVTYITMKSRDDSGKMVDRDGSAD